MHWSFVFVILIADASVASRYYPHQTQQPQQSAFQQESYAAMDDTYNPYNKHHSGRHVCTNQKNVSHPVRTKQVFCKPTYKKYMVRCNGNQLCTGVRLVYEKHYKDVITTTNTNEVIYLCCPGWTQISNRSHGCNKPLCSKPCQNGGKCIKPDICNCLENFTGKYCEIAQPKNACNKPCQNGGICNFRGICECTKGFKGLYCEIDVDECKENKPCDQICYNTPGNYTCECREDFILQKDGQSCRKENDEGTSFEANDLEFELLDKRLLKLEKMMDESHKNEATKSDIKTIYNDISQITNDVNDLKNKFNYMDNYKSDLYTFKNKLHQIEEKAEKIDDLLAKYEKMKRCAFYNKICI